MILPLIAIVIVLIFVHVTSKYVDYWKKIMAIPGPIGIPIFGTVSLMITNQETLFNCSHRMARKYFPIYKVWGFGYCYVQLFSPEDIGLVLSNMKHNKKNSIYEFLHCWLGTGLLTSSGSKWQRRRKILTSSFHFSILHEFLEIFNRETEVLVKVLEEKCHESYIDVVDPITDFTLNSIGATSFGVKLSDDPKCELYKKSIAAFGEHTAGRLVRPWLYENVVFRLTSGYQNFKSTSRILHDFSTSIIKERQKEFASGGKTSYSNRKKMAMLDLMLKAKYEGADIDDEGIREEVDTFMFEGHDTTAMALCFSLMLIANEKIIQEEIYKEIMEVMGDSEGKPTFKELGDLKFTERCIKECLRLYPSVHTIGRMTGEDVETQSGYIIPKNTSINMIIYEMHRSARVWENPEKFDPDRFLPDNIAKRHKFAYLPFSAGSRNCIGQRFAILEMKAVLCGILRKFKLEPVDNPENIRLKVDMILRPEGAIRVKFIPRA